MVGESEAILDALNQARMRYLVVGGVAVVLHGHLRITADLDLIIHLERDNVLRAMRALQVPLERTMATVIALEDLIALKRRAGRPRDQEDIAALEALRDAGSPTEGRGDG